MLRFILGSFLVVAAVHAADKKIVLVAGTPSHGPGDHEHRAGCLLLAHCLEKAGGFQTIVASNGWPADVQVLQEADAVIIYADGGDGHPAIRAERLKMLDALAARGVGIGALHYGVEVPAGDPGFAMLRWTGGYFEKFWSVNPTWTATFNGLPNHPVTRGVEPFSVHDEWYYHMRFAPEMKGVTPILSPVPGTNTLDRPFGPHSGNPFVRSEVLAGKSQPVMWVFDRPGGGRGFGFTGGHYHRNWGHESFRTLVLNAIAWIANADVPPAGIPSRLDPDDLRQNLDPKKN